MVYHGEYPGKIRCVLFVMNNNSKRFIALSGGVGGAKLVLGLSHVLDTAQLTVIANTGDDFEHLGLSISPDIDTLMYTLAGINNPELGWGRNDETWNFMDTIREIGLETWFRLGDRDLAVHLYRTNRLRENVSLSTITADLFSRFGIQTEVVPMSDNTVHTVLATDIGQLSFQEYFVRHRCSPRVTGIRFDGAENATPSPRFAEALSEKNLHAVIICPSNPFLSIQPVLALPAINNMFEAIYCPVIVVSPLVRNRALKGPTAGLMKDLDVPVTIAGLAGLYAGIADGIVIDNLDQDAAGEIEEMGMAVHTADIVMNSLQDRIDLANAVIEFSDRLRITKSQVKS